MTTFVSPFTGTVVTPTDVTYYPLAFSTDQQLDWEATVTPPEVPAARIMDCSASLAGLTVTLPAANEGTLGADILFRNVGAYAFTITDYEGGQSLVINPGVAKYVYLSDNTSLAGVWQNITFGASTSYADATTLAGYGLTSIAGKLSTTQNVVDASITFPTLNETSRAVTYNWTGGVATINLPATSGLSQGWYIGFRNNGTGTLTIQPNGSAKVNGQDSIETNPGDSGFIMYNNSTTAGFITVGWQTSANVSFTAATYDVDAVIGDELNLVTYAPIIQTYISQSGDRTTQLDVVLPAITQVYMLVNNTNPPLDSQYSITFHNEGSTDPYIELAPNNTLILLSDGLSLYPLTQTSVGTFYAADGSAEFPSYTFTNNPATGMYLADTNVLGLAANGHAMATFDYSNPSSPLITFNNPLTATLTAVDGGRSKMAADNVQQDTTQFTKIYTLSLPAGIKRDGTIFETNEYSDGVWCRFQRGQPKKMGGYRQVFNTHVGIYRGMIIQPHNGINYVFAGNYEELDVFTTNANYALGSGPYKAQILPGVTWAPVSSQGTNSVVVAGDVTAVFPPGSEVFFDQVIDPNVYTVATAVFAASNTTITVTDPTITEVGITKIWLNGEPFTGDPDNGPYNLLWQFDGAFNPTTQDLSILAHPGYNLQNIDNGRTSQVIVGDITPNIDNQWTFSGLSDSAGQNPTYQPIEVDGGVCMLYPFIFVYGSHGFIANNNVDNTAIDRSIYDWNGPLANQVNVAASKIVKGMPMRGGTNSPSGLFWATDSLIRVSFNSQATTNYWSYDIVSTQTSIMSSSSVVEMDGTFFWMGVDRFYLYNGQVAVLPNDKNVNWLFDNINYSQRQKVWATKVPRYNEIWFFYPRGTATECTDAIIYNVKDKLWYDAGQAIGSRRSCGYTTEILPTPLWAGWEYQPQYSRPYVVIENPESLDPADTNQFYLSGDKTPQFSPGSWVTANPGTNWNLVFRIESSVFILDEDVGMPGVTLVTMADYNQSILLPGKSVYTVTEGYSIWQHEFGQNAVTLSSTFAVQSSITTSDISWISGSPGGESLVGLNRRMHLRRVEPNFLQTGDMTMTVLGRKFANGAVNIENSGPFLFSPQDGKIDLRVEHRLVRLKFESNTVDGNYEMGRLVITAEFGDERP